MSEFKLTKEEARVVREFSAAEKKDNFYAQWKSVEVRPSSFGTNLKCVRVTLKNGLGFSVGFDSRDPHPVGSTIEPRFCRALVREKAEHGYYITTLSK